MENPLLSNFLREKIYSQYGSIRAFADAVELPYERLRKAFQRNRYSREDLDQMAEVLGIVGFDISTFEHKGLGRRNSATFRRRPLLAKSVVGIVPEEYVPFLVNNPVVLERIRTLVATECHRIREAIGQVSG